MLGVGGGVHHLLHVPAGSGMTRRPKEGQKSFGRDRDGIASGHFRGGLAKSLVDANRNGMAERKKALVLLVGGHAKARPGVELLLLFPKVPAATKKGYASVY